jgi:hypothetical protein
MSGFSFRKQIDGTNEHQVMSLLANDSTEFQKGDLIRVDADGNAALVTAGNLVLGVVLAVVDRNGLPVDPDSGTTDTWTTDSDNTTDATKYYEVQYIPALGNYLFYNDADSSLTASMMFQYFDVNDENDVDGESGSDSTISTVRLIERDPDGDGDASKGLFQIVESFWAQNCGGTVDTSGIEA